MRHYQLAECLARYAVSLVMLSRSLYTYVITKSQNKLNSDTVKRLILLKSWKVKNIKELEELNKEEDEEE